MVPAALKTAVLSATADGDNTVVAAVAGKKIRVYAYTLVVSALGGAKWKRGSTDLSGVMPLAANAGASPSCPPPGYLFETAPGEALVLNNGVGVDSFGHVTYAEIA